MATAAVLASALSLVKMVKDAAVFPAKQALHRCNKLTCDANHLTPSILKATWDKVPDAALCLPDVAVASPRDTHSNPLTLRRLDSTQFLLMVRVLLVRTWAVLRTQTSVVLASNKVTHRPSRVAVPI